MPAAYHLFRPFWSKCSRVEWGNDFLFQEQLKEKEMFQIQLKVKEKEMHLLTAFVWLLQGLIQKKISDFEAMHTNLLHQYFLTRHPQPHKKERKSQIRRRNYASFMQNLQRLFETCAKYKLIAYCIFQCLDIRKLLFNTCIYVWNNLFNNKCSDRSIGSETLNYDIQAYRPITPTNRQTDRLGHREV